MLSVVLFVGHLGNGQVPVWEIGNDNNCKKIFINRAAVMFCLRFSESSFAVLQEFCKQNISIDLSSSVRSNQLPLYIFMYL